jgi:hypothetical protein
MYSDRKTNRIAPILAIVLVFLLLCVLLFLVLGSSGKDLEEDGAMAIQDAVRRHALQCYVVEGVYPPDLAYLEENYGLQVNTRDYYVVYDAFASNIPPTIRVIKK